jgi:hypothetical protein
MMSNMMQSSGGQQGGQGGGQGAAGLQKTGEGFGDLIGKIGEGIANFSDNSNM